ncbi:hypothetical protein IX51_02675 [uncultured archaeon]|nr:hypothetical protein IX51_02675 [uncultured archaeon]
MMIEVKVNFGKSPPVATDDGLIIYTTAKRENNRANLDIIGQIADYYSIDTSRIRLVRGRTSRKKTFSVEIEE